MKQQKIVIFNAPTSTSMSKYEFSIFQYIQARLSSMGWTAVVDQGASEVACFENLIPPPDVTFSVMDDSTLERRRIAVHFYADDNCISYVCTMQLENSQVQESGRLSKDDEEIRILSTHDEWLYRTPTTPRPDSITIVQKVIEGGNVTPDTSMLNHPVTSEKARTAPASSRRGRRATPSK